MFNKFHKFLPAKRKKWWREREGKVQWSFLWFGETGVWAIGLYFISFFVCFGLSVPFWDLNMALLNFPRGSCTEGVTFGQVVGLHYYWCFFFYYFLRALWKFKTMLQFLSLQSGWPGPILRYKQNKTKQKVKVTCRFWLL